MCSAIHIFSITSRSIPAPPSAVKPEEADVSKNAKNAAASHAAGDALLRRHLLLSMPARARMGRSPPCRCLSDSTSPGSLLLSNTAPTTAIDALTSATVMANPEKNKKQWSSSSAAALKGTAAHTPMATPAGSQSLSAAENRLSSSIFGAVSLLPSLTASAPKNRSDPCQLLLLV